eukprot:m.43022 g.43022  ORF g.43022 m.43022 type:complete len:68 (+) comp7084_c1_seq3:1785-1988(+)
MLVQGLSLWMHIAPKSPRLSLLTVSSSTSSPTQNGAMNVYSYLLSVCNRHERSVTHDKVGMHLLGMT